MKFKIGMEKFNIHKALLGVHMYKLTEAEIYELRQSRPRPDSIFELLPEYTINKNESANNSIIVAKYYLQFTGTILPENDEEKNSEYLFIGFETMDRQLENEIDNCGIDELFAGIDMKNILSVFKPQTYKDLTTFAFTQVNYLVINIEYRSSYDYHDGGYDCDIEYKITGYLDNNLNFVAFQENNI